MGLLSLLATAVFLDDITKDPAEIERQKRIQEKEMKINLEEK